jgi:hypothetical protein
MTESDMPMDVMQLIELLLPYAVPYVDNITDQTKPRLEYMGITAETNSRRYFVTGVRTNEFGNPVIIIEFND